jgi:hypothetical protein
MFQRNGPSAGAEEAERLDLEKHARLEAGLIDRRRIHVRLQLTCGRDTSS